jgi:hypothetical protein
MSTALKILAATVVLIFYTSIAVSAPVPAYGQWLSYFPVGKDFTRQFTNNGAIMGRVASKQEPGVGRYDLYHSGTDGNPCTSGNVEEFEVKYCSMKNMDTGNVTYAQFVVFRATRTPTSPIRYVISVHSFDGEPAAQFFWDNNQNNVVDQGDTGFIVSCPGEGHPYAIHNIDSVPNIMRVWLKQDISGNGSNFSRRMFWQSLVQPPVDKFNSSWGNTLNSATQVDILHNIFYENSMLFTSQYF